jgi:hypothetical protein
MKKSRATETLQQVASGNDKQFKWAVYGEEEYGKGGKITWARYITDREAMAWKVKHPELPKEL